MLSLKYVQQVSFSVSRFSEIDCYSIGVTVLSSPPYSRRGRWIPLRSTEFNGGGYCEVRPTKGVRALNSLDHNVTPCSNHPRSETCFASFPNVPSLNKEGKIEQSLRVEVSLNNSQLVRPAYHSKIPAHPIGNKYTSPHLILPMHLIYYLK